MPDILERVEAVIVVASEGNVTAQALRDANGSLMDAGLDSMQILAVIMGLESEFGIIIDVNEDASFIASTATITEFVTNQLQPEVA